MTRVFLGPAGRTRTQASSSPPARAAYRGPARCAKASDPPPAELSSILSPAGRAPANSSPHAQLNHGARGYVIQNNWSLEKFYPGMVTWRVIKQEEDPLKCEVLKEDAIKYNPSRSAQVFPAQENSKKSKVLRISYVNLSCPQMNHHEKLPEENLTKLTEFILLDFADLPHLQWFLFGLFLIIYIIILLSNGAIFLITKLDTELQSPMYFFLANFSFLEICYVSATIPRMLKNLGTQRRSISLVACATQMCFVLMLGATECLLLTVMAYDRYVAICNPLHYPLVMNHRFCIQLVIGSWVTDIAVMIGQTYQIFSLPFCGPNQINHFFCDIPPILKLACGDTSVNEMLVYIVAVLFVIVPFLLILGSYSKIISTILKLSSVRSQAKAFSTCSSHLIVVVLFFGSATITYLRSKTGHSEGTGKMLSLFYTILTPMFNPMIYSLRNKDVIMALRKLLQK
ncbi:PREDICTED: olfactory receptor 10AG1-like [Chrysochloris asiatica]|uniref:Olfactory receptor 10AG1-like n=1 Tax=Chrysochloris asiatica TaxID=185453 RepID=A0A9B0UEB8_CHRAS|nr:PREDICTED: olfactory receptor 10AG1-like [Chrysochloris asiatica]